MDKKDIVTVRRRNGVEQPMVYSQYLRFKNDLVLVAEKPKKVEKPAEKAPPKRRPRKKKSEE